MKRCACGSDEAYIEQWPDPKIEGYKHFYYVRCYGCRAEIGNFDSAEQATEAWDAAPRDAARCDSRDDTPDHTGG